MRIIARDNILHKETNRKSRNKTSMTKLNKRINIRSEKLKTNNKKCDSSEENIQNGQRDKKNKRNSLEP